MLEIFLICTCLFLYYVWYYEIADKKGPPICKGCLPLLGHAHLVLKCNTHEYLRVSSKSRGVQLIVLYDAMTFYSKQCENLGGVMRGFIGPTTFYSITDPEDALRIGKSSINKHSFYQFAKNWIGSGLFIASGSTWTGHKKLLSPGFSLQALSEYIPEINLHTRRYLTILDSKVGKGPFDPSADIRLTTLKTIFSTLLSTSFEKDEDFYKLYIESLDVTLDCLTSRFQTVIYHSDFLYKFSKLRKTEQVAMKTANKMVEEVINSKLKTRKEEPTPENRIKTFLDLLLELEEEGKLTMQEVKDEINTTMTAALDTSSWVLNYILVLLGSHQDVQEKVVEELTKVLGNEDRDVDKQDISNLVYLEAVIKEVLRLHPPVPLTIRTLEKPVQLSKYTLSKGSHCVLILYAMNRSQWWGEDSESFRPERWFEREDLATYFAGFSVGRRSCIGKTYAMLTLKTMVAHIIRRYRITADASQLKFKFDFIVKPVDGHFISIERR